MSTSTANITEVRHRGRAAIADKTVLVTGANRGLGQALVEEAVRRGAKRVYAASRQPFTHPEERVRPLVLDVTNAAQIQAAAERVELLDILINNAGVSVPDDLSDSYSASKAAAFSLTQSLRARLAGRGVEVHAVLPGPIDTDMVRDLPIPKTRPQTVAQGIFDGVENGDEDIFPDPMSAMMAEAWRTGVGKELERQNAALVQVQPVAA